MMLRRLLLSILFCLTLSFAEEPTARLQVQSGSEFRNEVLSPNSRILAVMKGGNMGKAFIAYFDFPSMRQIGTLGPFDDYPDTVMFTADSRHILVGLRSREIQLLDITTRTKVWSQYGIKNWQMIDNLTIRAAFAKKISDVDIPSGRLRNEVPVPVDFSVASFNGDEVFLVGEDKKLISFRGGKPTPLGYTFDIAPANVTRITPDRLWVKPQMDLEKIAKKEFSAGFLLIKNGAAWTQKAFPMDDIGFRLNGTKLLVTYKGSLNEYDLAGEISKPSRSLKIPYQDYQILAVTDDYSHAFFQATTGDDAHYLLDAALNPLFSIASTTKLSERFGGSYWENILAGDGRTMVGVSSFPESFLQTIDMRTGAVWNLQFVKASVLTDCTFLRSAPAIVVETQDVNFDPDKVTDEEDPGYVQQIVIPDAGTAIPIPGDMRFIEQQALPFGKDVDIFQTGDKLYTFDLLNGDASEIEDMNFPKGGTILTFMGGMVTYADPEGARFLVGIFEPDMEPIKLEEEDEPLPYDAAYQPPSDSFWQLFGDKLTRYSLDFQNVESFGMWPNWHLERLKAAAANKQVLQVDRFAHILDASKTDEEVLVGSSETMLIVDLKGEGITAPRSLTYGSAGVMQVKDKKWTQLVMKGFEPRAGCMAPEGGTAYITTDIGDLIEYDTKTGQPKRKMSLGEDCWKVGIMNGGKLIAAAGESGLHMILKDEFRDLGTMYFMPDKSWVFVDTQSHFDTSNADSISGLNWLVSDDPLHPIPIDVFFRTHYEPRLLQRLMQGEVIKSRSIASLNRAQPKVTIGDPKFDAATREASISVTVEGGLLHKEAGEEKSIAKDLRLFIDGRLAAAEISDISSGPGDSKVISFSHIRFEHHAKGDPIQISAYAVNKDQVKSETARLTWPLPEAIPAVKPRAFVISVGVNRSADPRLKLAFAANDASVMQKELTDSLTATGDFEKVVGIPLISDDNADNAQKDKVKSAFANLTNPLNPDRPNPEDLVIVTWSGHGVAPADGQFYLLPSDIDSSFDAASPKSLATAISTEEMARWMQGIDARQIALVVDACHSAQTVEAEGFRPGPMGSRGLGQLAYDKGMIVIAASQAADVALESGGLGHGLLTYALAIDGIEKKELFKEKAKEGSILDWFNVGEKNVPMLHEAIRTGKLSTASKGTERVSYQTDNRVSVQQPQIFDYSRRENPWMVFKSN